MNNLSISISFIIGGLLLISVLTLNTRVMQNSGETVLNMTAKKTITNISQFMRRDFVRMGYNVRKKDTTIQSFSGEKIVFWADIDNNPSTGPALITWEFTQKKDSHTVNPNDYQLIRIGPIDGKIDTTIFPITYDSTYGAQPNFQYFDKNGNATTTASQIRTIAVTLQTQSPAKYGNDQYSTSLLSKRFTPPPINLQDVNWNK